MNLDKIINESVKKVLREGLYGYPDDLDQIILAFNSDGECYRVYERILMSLLKKVNRGVELDFNTLVNSSVMKKLQSMILRKFKRYQNNFTKESYYKLREYIARKMFEDIEEGNYTYDDNKILKENFQIEGSPKSLGIDIARYLFDNGIDVYEFTNQVEKEYEMMEKGKFMKVKGYKSMWPQVDGEVEVIDPTWQFEDGEFIAEAEDVTALLGTEELVDKMNKFVSFKGMTVEPIGEGGEAFLYNSEGTGEEGDDLYFKVSVNGAEYTFTVESYLCGPDTDVYKAVKELKVGDVVDLEGFLYWYEGPNPHITAVTVK